MTVSEADPLDPGDPAPGVEPSAYRQAARQFATGVTVATASDGSRVHAITATAFCPLSLDPPLVLIALDSAGRLLPMVREGGHVGVSVLAEDQRHIGEWAAQHGRTPGTTLPGIDVEISATGAPLLRGSVAWFDCVVDKEYAHGDHVLVVGRVVATAVDETRRPLLYFRRRYRHLAPEQEA